MARQRMSNPLTDGVVPPPPSKAQRNRDWEKNQTKATYRIPVDLRNRVTKLSKDLGVSTGDLARALLEFGLESYERGDLVLRPELRPGRFTLFPE